MITPFPGATPTGPTMAGHPAARPRVIFYTHEETSLGHLRRVHALVWELARRRPDASLLGLLSHPEISSFAWPASFDFLKLPTIRKVRLYEDLTDKAARAGPRHGVMRLREAIIRQVLQASTPRLVVVDYAATGPDRELTGPLQQLRASWPRPMLVLILRDIDQEGAWTQRAWKETGIRDLLDRVYDRILVVGSRDVFDLVQEYALSPAAAAKTEFCGYIRRAEILAPPAQLRQQLGATGLPLVVVTVGGGIDGKPILIAYLETLRSGLLGGLASLIVSGPFLPEAARAELVAAADGLSSVTLTPFTPDLPSYLNAADLVLTMAGHNATVEAVSLGKRTVVVPRAAAAEQGLRAQRFAERGLVRVLSMDDLTPERLAAVVRDALAGPPPSAALDFGGLQRIGQILETALEISPPGPD